MKGLDISELLPLQSKTRALVLEKAVDIEDLISFAIGYILDIDYSSSRALGSSSGALSFNQKVLLWQDKKGISTEIKNKLQTLMEIRNKFAHVRNIDSFDAYFQLAPNGYDKKKHLLNWYKVVDEEFDNEEVEYKNYFLKLCSDLFNNIVSMLLDHTKTVAEFEAVNEFNAMFVSILKEKQAEGKIDYEIYYEVNQEAIARLREKAKDNKS